MTAGDRPLDPGSDEPFLLPDASRARELMAFYFEVCSVTYRCLHRNTVETWLEDLLSNVSQGLSPWRDNAKSAAVLMTFAIATLRQEKLGGPIPLDLDALSLASSDQFFQTSLRLTDCETGLPRLESTQARLLQVLYLLQTSRMNQAWYIFGSTTQIVLALGLHRRSGRRWKGSTISPDYINAQLRKRTFWTAYIIDKYLSIVLGRPQQLHDDDIDQDFPDGVNDEDMTHRGPLAAETEYDCYIDALVCHAK